MSNKQHEELEKIIRTRLIRLNAQVSGITTGIITGLILFAATLWLVIKGGDVVGPHLSLLGQFLPGYRVTAVGSFIGLAYGFIGGYLVGYGVAYLYNWLVALRKKPEHTS